jgi:hypothetical protein
MDGTGSAPGGDHDKNLINPWGVAFGPSGPFWITDNNSGYGSFGFGRAASITHPQLERARG